MRVSCYAAVWCEAYAVKKPRREATVCRLLCIYIDIDMRTPVPLFIAASEPESMPNTYCMIMLFNLVSNHGYVHTRTSIHMSTR